MSEHIRVCHFRVGGGECGKPTARGSSFCRNHSALRVAANYLEKTDLLRTAARKRNLAAVVAAGIALLLWLVALVGS